MGFVFNQCNITIITLDCGISLIACQVAADLLKKKTVFKI